jgi:hypothetical protein
MGERLAGMAKPKLVGLRIIVIEQREDGGPREREILTVDTELEDYELTIDNAATQVGDSLIFPGPISFALKATTNGERRVQHFAEGRRVTKS